jgi:hypothetical protein
MPAQKVLNIVRKKIGRCPSYIDSDDWSQEALLAYEKARSDHPENEGEHIFAAIQAVQKMIRREYREYHERIVELSATVTGLQNDTGLQNEQRTVLFALLARQDQKTRSAICYLLDGHTQLAVSLKLGVSPAWVNRRVKSFIAAARRQFQK